MCNDFFYEWLFSHRTTFSYGVATISRLLKITGLFCKRALEKRPIFSKRDLYVNYHPICKLHSDVCLDCLAGLEQYLLHTFSYRVAKTHRMPSVASHFSQKKPLNRRLFCGKWPLKTRHPMGFRHPVHAFSSAYYLAPLPELHRIAQRHCPNYIAICQSHSLLFSYSSYLKGHSLSYLLCTGSFRMKRVILYEKSHSIWKVSFHMKRVILNEKSHSMIWKESFYQTAICQESWLIVWVRHRFVVFDTCASW